MRNIIFGIRKSKLAQAQLDEFKAHLVKCGINADLEVKTIQTKGDTDKGIPQEKLGQGVFVKELEQELLSGNIDCAVHSLKDVPVEIAPDTTLACFPPRADERDCLVYRDGVRPNNLNGCRIGIGSPRREAFIKELRGSLKMLPIRGNVDTRLKKLDEGNYDAIILAACGLRRIKRTQRISEYFDSDTFVPSAGQGALCVQIRQSDTGLNSLLKGSSCSDTEIAVESERAVLKALGAGCRIPFGVFARFKENEFVITAKAYIQDRNNPYCYCKLTGPRTDHEKITGELIEKLKREAGNFLFQ